MIENVKLDFEIKKPITFFDLETTGLDLEQDRIIQMSAIQYQTNGLIKNMKQNFNPEGRIISKEAEAKHGINNEMLLNEPTFREKAEFIFNEFFLNSDLGGFNIRNFDLPLMTEELKRSDISFDPLRDGAKIIDVYKILTKMEPRTLEASYQFYTNEILDSAHDANADNIATLKIFNEQIKKYDFKNPIEDGDFHTKTDKEGNVAIDFSGVFIKTTNGKFLFAKGKHKGEEVSDGNSPYLDWIFNKSTFNNNTKFVAKKLYDYIKGKKK